MQWGLCSQSSREEQGENQLYLLQAGGEVSERKELPLEQVDYRRSSIARLLLRKGVFRKNMEKVEEFIISESTVQGLGGS